MGERNLLKDSLNMEVLEKDSQRAAAGLGEMERVIWKLQTTGNINWSMQINGTVITGSKALNTGKDLQVIFQVRSEYDN